MRSYFLCWLLLVISMHALCQEPLPIMELYDFVEDPNNILKNSGCKDGLMNAVDFFTVRGKVNRNGANPDAHRDTNLYLQAVKDSSTNAWASQCRPDLTMCESNLTTDCYCERKDANGDYHLVMTIMARSIYSSGKLMLSWNDARSPYYPPITSNIVNYYPGTINTWCQEPLPIMELYDFVDDPNNIIKNSGCKDGLMNDVDYFTLRGKVNKNGANTDSYIDTNLYLQAVRDPSTNAWASQSRPDLTICERDPNTDCYCERKDPNGDYHLVMTIMVKSIYSGGKLMLSWNDARSPHNPPITSNTVNYYPGTINTWCQEPLPIMELYDFVDDPNNIIKNSGCKDGLMNDVDYFTVRGKVNKNGANTDSYIDTNLYLQAVKDPSTNAWASQCRPDLTACGSYLNTDCYCERKDVNGDYHLVMTIMAKYIYSGGKLMLSWNDARSPHNPPITSNTVNYYPGTINTLPSDPPKMSAQSCQHDNILVEGDRVTVTCDVSGGYPSVQSVILSCGQDHSVTSIGTSAKLTLEEIGLSYNQTECTCQAAHVTGCDGLMSVLTLTIIPSKHVTSVCTVGELAGAVSGAIIGTLVFVAVIAFITFWIRKKRQAKNRNTDEAYDTIERRPTPHYQNLRPDDPNYRAINLPVQVSETETTKQETIQETDKNQAFDDYLEPTVPDHYVYSELEEH